MPRFSLADQGCTTDGALTAAASRFAAARSCPLAPTYAPPAARARAQRVSLLDKGDDVG